ncbi:MAG: Maf family protein [Gemmatimonadota bacterium]|nr:Maf family protein [Gemmatimonadota bacterium]
MKPLILGSASPRRADLLRQLALPFTVVPSPVAEPVPATSIPADYALESAVAKARAVAGAVSADAIIIAADTIVCSNGAILGKPADAADAASMLGRLSGKVHQVYTGLAIQSGDQLLQEVVCTQVEMRALTAADIAAYVASGEPLDKAGGYGIQGLGARFIERIAGCYYNVVGLPLARLCVLLSAVGCDLNDQATK